jgi:HicA toxin of bacterial toxin-antitoxin,
VTRCLKRVIPRRRRDGRFCRDVVARLRAAGYEFKRSRHGDHAICWHPETNVRLTVDRKLRSKITANEILMDAGLQGVAARGRAGRRPPRHRGLRRGHARFEAISLSIALSNMASANSFFSLEFSSSSALSRLASDKSRPPYLALRL